MTRGLQSRNLAHETDTCTEGPRISLFFSEEPNWRERTLLYRRLMFAFFSLNPPSAVGLSKFSALLIARFLTY